MAINFIYFTCNLTKIWIDGMLFVVIYITINHKRKYQKKNKKQKKTKGITSSKITTTVFELDTVYIHTISCNIELHKTACLFSVSILCEQTLYVKTSDVTLPLTV